MAKVTRTRSGGTRQTILDAAAAEIRAVGFLETSLETIAARAGVSKMSVYYHFESKDALCVEAVTATMARCAEELSAGLMEPTTTLAGLEKAVEIIWKHFIFIGQGLSSLLDEFRRIDPVFRMKVESATNAYAKHIARLISKGQERGDLIDGTPMTLAHLFIGSIASTIRWYDLKGKAPSPKFLDLLRKTIPRLLTKPDENPRVSTQPAEDKSSTKKAPRKSVKA